MDKNALATAEAPKPTHTNPNARIFAWKNRLKIVFGTVQDREWDYHHMNL